MNGLSIIRIKKQKHCQLEEILLKNNIHARGHSIDEKPTFDCCILLPEPGNLGQLETMVQKFANQGKERWLLTHSLGPKIAKSLHQMDSTLRFLIPADFTNYDLAQRIMGDWFFLHPPRAGSPMVGGTKILQDMDADLTHWAEFEEPVLILGETGTGKELAARRLHGNRDPKRFHAVNCGALKEFESEIFGHERGAFTGADKKRPGKLVQTDGGTLFLDEIGNLSMENQAKILRFLQDGRFTPLGSDQELQARVRLVFATNEDLDKRCREGSFRHDLLMRIDGLRHEVPPLRKRMGDIPLLVNHFIEAFNTKYNTHLQNPTNFNVFYSVQWLGNIRQLQRTIFEWCIQSRRKEGSLDPTKLQRRMELIERSENGTTTHQGEGHWIVFDPSRDQWKDLEKRAFIKYATALEDLCGGDKKEAAAQSGMSNSAYYDRRKKSFGEA